MSIVMQVNPFDYFPDLYGNALTEGYVWIGQPNKDPRQYPAAVFFDSALTIPAAQPLRTNAGYIVRGNTPTTLFINGNYSVLVQDKQGRQVYLVPDFLVLGSLDLGNILKNGLILNVDSVAAVRALSSGQYTHAFASGYEPGTAGGGHYDFDPTDTTSADDGGTVLVASDGARWKLRFQKFVTVEQFGVLSIPGRNNFIALQRAVSVCYTKKIELCAGSGTFEYGTTLDLSYPTLVMRGNGFRNTVFKFTGSGRAMDAIGTRPNNGIYSFDIDLSDFTIEGNANATDLLRIRINHARLVRLNAREGSPTAGCGFKIEGTVAGHYEQLTCSTNTQLMASRMANGIIFDVDVSMNSTRPTLNTLISPCIEGTIGDGIVEKACDMLTVIGGTSENNDGNGLSELAGCQMNSYIGFDCESNRGFADLFIAGQSSHLKNCGSTKYTLVDNSARLTKIEGGWYDKLEISAGAVAVTVDGVKTRFFGGAIGLVTNNNAFLSTRNIYDSAAGTFVFFSKPGAAIALTGSPMTYTNVNINDETILLSGTVTQIVYNRGGLQFLVNPSTGAIRLQPGDGITISYSGTPTATRIPGGTNFQ